MVVSDGEQEDYRLARAAAWRVALSEADVESSRDFEAWLADDPRNAEAWSHMGAVWDHFGDNGAAPELMAARRAALARATQSQTKRFHLAQRRPWSPALIAASTAAAMVVIGLGATGVWYVAKPAVYRTALGERRTVLLADGSRVALDSGTVLKVRLLANARKLDLLQGQARFDVAHDASRPFQVHAGDETVVATGTNFNVDLIGPKVLVTLIEGRVSVLKDRPAQVFSKEPQAPRPVLARLTAGEELVATEPNRSLGQRASSVAPVQLLEKVNLDKTTAWESGQLVFEDEPLSSVAQRVSRYAEHPIMTHGSAASLKISGVFNAGDTNTFIDTVERAFPIDADQQDDGTIILRPRS